jgi:cell division septation protein DedD
MTHPEMTRMLLMDRQRELIANAEAHRKARFARRSRKAERADEVSVPMIPDFVDGTFATATPATAKPATAKPATAKPATATPATATAATTEPQEVIAAENAIPAARTAA